MSEGVRMAAANTNDGEICLKVFVHCVSNHLSSVYYPADQQSGPDLNFRDLLVSLSLNKNVTCN